MQNTLAASNDERAQLLQRLGDVVTQCDPDRLARVLGLRSAQAAIHLRANEAARHHLVTRLAQGCGDATPDEAVAMTRLLFAEGADG